jgi:hypothetical protein
MRRRWYLLVLLLLPFGGTLMPAIYNRELPQFAGMPFFYWYQLAWVPLTALLLGCVVLLTRGRGDV